MTTNFVKMACRVVPAACFLFGFVAAMPTYAAQTGTNVLKPAAQTGTNVLKPAAQTGTNVLKPAAQTGTNLLRAAAQTGTNLIKPSAQTGTNVARPVGKKEGECEYSLTIAASASC
jgi:hypothetical protein